MSKQRFPHWGKVGMCFVFLLMIASLCTAQTLSQRRSLQVSDYNRAILALQAGKYEQAISLFNQSLADYQAQASAGFPQSLFTPPPSPELAAMAYFHEGVAYVAEAQEKQQANLIGQAMIEFQNSLKINPGAPYAGDVAPSDAARMNDEALTCKHDLELLLMQHPDQSQSLQNAQPQPGQGPPGPPQPGQPGGGQGPGSSGGNDGV